MNLEQRGTTSNGQPLPANDYVSPGLATVFPDAAFPSMIIGDTSVPQWPWLRRWVEHNWYTDRRNPYAGFASRDEVALLYNNALLLRGKPCLEVGCWRGWSAVHIALATGDLDIIDPVFADPDFESSIRASCTEAGVLDTVRFHTGFSPGAIDTLSQSTGKRWSFIFIDADHEGDAPRLDAEAAIRNTADTAMVMFHDLASPYVAAGLDAMRNAGWRTMVYQTMQIMGVAWRGNVEPVAHQPDPKVFWTLPHHLSGYEVSGWKRPTLRPDGAWWPGMSMQDRRDAAMMRAQAAEDDRVTSLVEMDRQAAVLQAERAAAENIAAQLPPLHAEVERQAAFIIGLQSERDAEHVRIGILQTERDNALGRTATAQFERDQTIRRAYAAERSVAELAAVSGRQLAQLQSVSALRARISVLEHENAALPELARWISRKRVLLGLLRRGLADRIASVDGQAAILGVSDLVTPALLSWLCRRRMLLGLFRHRASFGEVVVGYALLQAAQARRAHTLGEISARIEEDSH